jgi:hypothetical protein
MLAAWIKLGKKFQTKNNIKTGYDLGSIPNERLLRIYLDCGNMAWNAGADHPYGSRTGPCAVW